MCRIRQMPKKSACIRVPKKNGQKTLTLARKLRIVSPELEIQRNMQFIFIPILNGSIDALNALRNETPDAEIFERIFQERKHKTSLIRQLEEELPSDLLANLPHSMDILGDIAIIEIPHELDNYRTTIGEAILLSHRNIHTVLAKAGPVGGRYRLRQFTVVAGEPKTGTLYKEHGCKYYIDISKVYFSPRLSSERARISSLVKEGETIVDMFAGVGPFAIQIAKNHKDVKVFAIDTNPDAIYYLAKNTRLNRVEERVQPCLGDARQIVRERFLKIADRVIMNLPEKAIDYVDVACDGLKLRGGIIHFYSFATAANPAETIKKQFIRVIEKSGRELVCVYFRRVRETAPFESQIVLDAEIR
jgi:tRNA (guanine37-N1)-methyltransferase